MADFENNEEDRKLFVGGLPQECSQEDLEEYFGTFGEIDNVKLKMDQMTGRSRGFAFVLYKDEEGVEKATAGTEHTIKDKKVTVKKADVKQGKIYVGKLPETGMEEEDIKNHFSQFGPIAEVIRPIDKSKNNEPKNFCFVTFEKERVAKKLIEEGSCTISGHKMLIKQVTPNPRDPSQRGGRGGRGGYGGSPWMNQGGYGGGYGGWGGDQGGYGGGSWGGDSGYGSAGGYGGSWGADQGYGSAMGGTWSAEGGYGGGYGGYGDQSGGFGGGRGGGKMRGGRGGGRGRGGRGRPY